MKKGENELAKAEGSMGAWSCGLGNAVSDQIDGRARYPRISGAHLVNVDEKATGVVECPGAGVRRDENIERVK